MRSHGSAQRRPTELVFPSGCNSNSRSPQLVTQPHDLTGPARPVHTVGRPVRRKRTSIRGCRRSRSGWSSCGKHPRRSLPRQAESVGVEGSDRTVRRARRPRRASGRVGGGCIGRGPRAGHVGAVGLGRGPGHRRATRFARGWRGRRVVIATWDRTLPTVIACVDRAMRAFGGAATYWLTDNGHGHDRPRRRDRRAPSGDRCGRRPLRRDGRDVCAGGP